MLINTIVTFADSEISKKDSAQRCQRSTQGTDCWRRRHAGDSSTESTWDIWSASAGHPEMFHLLYPLRMRSRCLQGIRGASANLHIQRASIAHQDIPRASDAHPLNFWAPAEHPPGIQGVSCAHVGGTQGASRGIIGHPWGIQRASAGHPQFSQCKR